MKYVRTHGGIVGCVAVACLLFVNGAVADERKHGKRHSMDMDYSKYMDGDHYGEIRGHGKTHGQSKKHGYSKKHEHHGMYGDAHHHVFSLHTIKKKLHLTDSQVDTLRPIEADYRKAVIGKKADIRIAEIDLGLLIGSQSPDRGQLQAIVDSIGRLKAELMMVRIEAFLNVKKELTVEQQERFSKMGHGYAVSAYEGHHDKKGHHGQRWAWHGPWLRNRTLSLSKATTSR